MNEYPVFTNSLGFRDTKVRAVPLTTGNRRILLIGDSFTEGIGLPYEQTFPGLLQVMYNDRAIEFLNAAVVSYSPKFYHLKVRHLIESVELQIDEVIVFIDISDILNEITYEEFEPSLEGQIFLKFKSFIYRHSILWYTISNIYNNSKKNRITRDFPPIQGAANIDEIDLEKEEFISKIPQWTLDKTTYEQWGIKGLKLAESNMYNLVRLCKQEGIKMSIAVYPWPINILYNDLESIQVRFWRRFAIENQIALINLFPEFIQLEEDPQAIVSRYFMNDKTHWNAAGHKVVAEAVSKYIK